MITLIAACASNRVIGKDNKLIWRVPGDLKRFKDITTGHTILMGRKTYESLGRPLPNRRNIVLSRDKSLVLEGCLTYTSISEVLGLYKNDLFVIGGEQIYELMLPFADRIELTYIDKKFDGDAYFPVITSNFVESKRIDMVCDEFKYSYITYDIFSLKSTDLISEGWSLLSINRDGGTKVYSKNEYTIEYNGNNIIYLKDKNPLLRRIKISKVDDKKSKLLFEGDIFNKEQLHDTLKLFGI